MALSTLAHRVEAERRLAFGRELRIKPVTQGFFWEAFGVLADLGDAEVAVTNVETGSLNVDLQRVKHGHVAADCHHPDVGLVTEHCCGDHLAIR